MFFYGLQNSHHPLLEVYAHDFRNNKSQKKTPAASDRCSTINYLFFIKTNTDFLNSPNLKLSACIGIIRCILEILLFQPQLFFLILWNVNPLNLENNRACSVITAGDHHSVILETPLSPIPLFYIRNSYN